MTIALLVNPTARSGAHTGAAADAAHLLRERGLATTIISGGSAAESSELLRTAIGLGVDAVVVAGGDGTVSLAVQELAGTGIPLGIVPAGTGNDFAGALGLRALDVAAAAELIAAGATRTIDLARVTRADGSTQLFGSVLASGFDSLVNDRANAMTWPRGQSRYTIAILVEFLRLRGIPFEVELRLADGSVERIAGDLMMATVGNTTSYGGGIPICPDADPSDGLLDVTLIRPAGRLRLLRLLLRAYRGTHGSFAEVSMRRVRSRAALVSRRHRLCGRRPDRNPAGHDRRRAGRAEDLRAGGLVRRLGLAQPDQHLIAQLLGCGLLARPRHHVGQRLRDERLVAAPGAMLQVLRDVRVLRAAHLVAQVLLEIATCLVASAVGHFVLPVAAVEMPRSLA